MPKNRLACSFDITRCIFHKLFSAVHVEVPHSFHCHRSVPRQGCHGFQERLAASQEAMKNKNIVNLGAIRQGMKRFQFLLNCCEPGTIPDASILAAALDLVSSVSYVYI